MYCSDCGSEMRLADEDMVPDQATREYPVYYCERCSQLQMHVLIEESLEITDEARAEGGDDDGDYSVVADVQPDGASGRREVRKTDQGEIVISSSAWVPGRFRASEEEEEREAVERLLPAYNERHGTDYSDPVNNDEEESEPWVDVWAYDESAEENPQGFQVTVFDTKPWKHLATDGSYSEKASEEDVLSDLQNWADIKSNKSSEDTVLVLDGWPPMPEQLLESLVEQLRSDPPDLDFKEIWYVDRSSMGYCKCIT